MVSYSPDSAPTVHDQDIALPRMYHVILLNDNTTPMGFVCAILQRLFRHDQNAASRITMATHCGGRGVAGTYPRDIAEAKAGQVAQAARLRGWPLRCTIEPEER